MGCPKDSGLTARTFYEAISLALLRGCYSRTSSHSDRLGWGDPKGPPGTRRGVVKQWWRSCVDALGKRIGFVRGQPDSSEVDRAAASLAAAIPQLAAMAGTYCLLADQYSRDLLIALLCLRVLGRRRVELPRSSADYWELVRGAERELRKEVGTFAVEGFLGTLDLYEFREDTASLRINTLLPHATSLFLMGQYQYRRGGKVIDVSPEDVVIDGGACWGDTSLIFANKAGEQGKVFAFEFVPASLDIFRANMELNPQVSGVVHERRRALWSESGRTLGFDDQGVGTACSEDGGTEASVETVSIDDFVRDEKLDRVDFIKLDVEGAELEILKGAEATLRRFRPKLAISAYHKPDDLIELPQWLSQLDAGYSLYLDHFSSDHWETVLFASAADRQRRLAHDRGDG